MSINRLGATADSNECWLQLHSTSFLQLLVVSLIGLIEDPITTMAISLSTFFAPNVDVLV